MAQSTSLCLTCKNQRACKYALYLEQKANSWKVDYEDSPITVRACEHYKYGVIVKDPNRVHVRWRKPEFMPPQTAEHTECSDCKLKPLCLWRDLVEKTLHKLASSTAEDELNIQFACHCGYFFGKGGADK